MYVTGLLAWRHSIGSFVRLGNYIQDNGRWEVHVSGEYGTILHRVRAFNLVKPVAKVSIVGVGMRSHSGIAAKVFETLGQGGINIEMISTSEIKISVVVEAGKGEAATQQLHDTFFPPEN